MSALEYAVERANRELGRTAPSLQLIARAQEILGESPTARQLEVLALIASGRKRAGHPPTFAELARALCVTSLHTVACHLEPLRKRGLVTWEPKKARTLAVTVAGQRWLPREAA